MRKFVQTFTIKIDISGGKTGNTNERNTKAIKVPLKDVGKIGFSEKVFILFSFFSVCFLFFAACSFLAFENEKKKENEEKPTVNETRKVKKKNYEKKYEKQRGTIFAVVIKIT